MKAQNTKDLKIQEEEIAALKLKIAQISASNTDTEDNIIILNEEIHRLSSIKDEQEDSIKNLKKERRKMENINLELNNKIQDLSEKFTDLQTKNESDLAKKRTLIQINKYLEEKNGEFATEIQNLQTCLKEKIEYSNNALVKGETQIKRVTEILSKKEREIAKFKNLTQKIAKLGCAFEGLRVKLHMPGVSEKLDRYYSTFI